MDQRVIVVVWWDRAIPEVAAGYNRRAIGGLIEQGASVVLLPLNGAPVPDLWKWVGAGGGQIEVAAEASVAACVTRIASVIHPDEVVHVLRGDVLVSWAWWGQALAALGAGAGIVGPVGHLERPQWVDAHTDGGTIEGFAARCAEVAGAARMTRVDHLGDACVAARARTWRLVAPQAVPKETPWRWRLRLLSICAVVASNTGRPMVLDGVWAEPCGRPPIVPPLGDHVWRAAVWAAASTFRSPDPAVWTAVWLVQPQTRHQLELLIASVRSVPHGVRAVVYVVGTVTPWVEQADGVRTEGQRIAAARNAIRSAAGRNVEVVPAPAAGSSPQLIEQAIGAALRGWVLWLREGLCLDGVTLDDLLHLSDHPDPSVYAYNVQIVHAVGGGFAWTDEPAGDGGDGSGVNGNDWLICRAGLPRLGVTSGGRVSRIRLVSTGLEDPRYRRPWKRPALRVEPLAATQPIAVGMLAYEQEDPDGVLRWADLLWGLAPVVVGWTGTAPVDEWATIWIPGGVHEVVRVREQGAETDLGAWRQELAATLHSVAGPTGWVAQVDPDEWPENPIAFALALRRMPSRGGAASLWRFRNLQPSGATSTSAVVRAYGPAARGVLSWVGVVHETLAGVEHLNADGAIVPFPVELFNRATPDLDTAARKLALYRQLLRVEIARRPERAQPWVLLAYQYAADGHWSEAIRCYEVAERLAPAAYLATYERGMLLVQLGLAALSGCLPRIPADHFHRPGAVAVVSQLQALALPQLPAVGPTADPDPLPPIPDGA